MIIVRYANANFANTLLNSRWRRRDKLGLGTEVFLKSKPSYLIGRPVKT